MCIRDRFKLLLITAFQPLKEISSAKEGNCPPALFTKISVSYTHLDVYKRQLKLPFFIGMNSNIN